MTNDQQAGTLAFLQNFYTGVTLYMPFEAEERAAAELSAPVAAEPAAVAAPLAVAAASAVSAKPTPPPVAPATAAPIAPAVVAAPAPAPVPSPGKLPSLSAVPPLPPMPPARSAAPPAPAAVPAPPAAAAPPAAPIPVPSAEEVPGYLRTTFDTLGSHARGVVLLVRLPDAQFQKLPRNVFLNKLLQAIGLVMADVVLVNLHGPYPVALENLRREIAATQILAFGKNLLDVAIRTTQIYEPVRFFNLNLDYLAAAEVEMVEYDTSLKKRLWVGLKAMFL